MSHIEDTLNDIQMRVRSIEDFIWQIKYCSFLLIIFFIIRWLTA